MPEDLLHRIEIDAASEHQCAGSMAQIVQPAVWQALFFEFREDAPEGVRNGRDCQVPDGRSTTRNPSET